MTALPADPLFLIPTDDYAFMLRAWNSESPALRDVALSFADRNRIRAERTPDRLSSGCFAAVARAISPTYASEERR